MQKGFLFISLLIGSYISGQPVTKLYGFSQPASPGIVKARNPSDSSKKEWSTRLNYTFYLESRESLKPVEVWVNQQRFAVSATQRIYSPVKHPIKDSILVPFSNKNLRECQDRLQVIQSIIRKRWFHLASWRWNNYANAC